MEVVVEVPIEITSLVEVIVKVIFAFTQIALAIAIAQIGEMAVFDLEVSYSAIFHDCSSCGWRFSRSHAHTCILYQHLYNLSHHIIKLLTLLYHCFYMFWMIYGTFIQSLYFWYLISGSQKTAFFMLLLFQELRGPKWKKGKLHSWFSSGDSRREEDRSEKGHEAQKRVPHAARFLGRRASEKGEITVIIITSPHWHRRRPLHHHHHQDQ